MNKRIINEINQIKSMMGLKESEVDEQSIKSAIDGFRQGIKNTLNKNSETSTNTEDDYYEGKPVSQILKDIDNTKSASGKIDVNGKTLYYGVYSSRNMEISRSKADLIARNAMAKDLGKTTKSNNVTTTTQTQIGVSIEINRVFQTSDGNYKTYILIKQS